MAEITANPTITRNPNQGVSIFYLQDGSAIFGCIGSPENVVFAKAPSLAIDLQTGDVYTQTSTTYANTGWTVLGGGGGAGTVTSVSVNDLLPLFTSLVANPTTTPAVTFTLENQNANRIFAGPSTGVPAIPSFRTLVAADIPAIAALPTNGIQYNDGANGFAGSVNLLFDPSTASVQVGAALGITGKLQLRSSVSGSIIHTVDNPASNYTYVWPNAVLTNNDLLTVGVSGSTMTISGVARSVVSGPTINATDGVIPYRSSATAFSDSMLNRISATILGFGGSTSGVPAIISSASGFSGTTGLAISEGAGSTMRYLGAGNVTITNTFANIGAPTGCRLGQSALDMVSGYQTAWSSNASNAIAGSDVGITRRQAGYLRITNASTGIGGLLVGGSTATPVGQTHLINGAVGVEPLYLEAIASTSVPTIRGVQSSVQSFAFNPNGKLQGGCNIPTSNQQFSAKGNLKSDVSQIGNVGTGQDNLLSFAVPAASIANNGDTVEFKTTFEFAANANNKEVEILFGGVSVFLVSDLFSGSFAEVIVRIKRTGATTAKVIATWISSDTLLRADCQYTPSAAITWANANTFQVQGEATATDDIINLELESNVIIAQTS